MTTPPKIPFLSDEQHGWAVLDPALAKDLGLTTEDFTQFSYVSSDGVIYAEEDCDAATVLAAYLRKYDVFPDVRENHVSYAPCRNYARCNGPRSEDAWQEANTFISQWQDAKRREASVA